MKRVWIFNHYAGKPSNMNGLRHYYFSKYLIENGYESIVFASSTIHNSDKNLIKDHEKYIISNEDGIPFVYVKARSYQGNGMKRIFNMFDYYRGLFKVSKKFERPDIIVASSVHPLTLLAGIKLARKYKIPCICEVRDLWPESFVAYDVVKKFNPILGLLYMGEKWLYKKADKLIFTMEGGKDYIIEKGWNREDGGPIDLDKVYHINNGIDLNSFKYNLDHYVLKDNDLSDTDFFKVIYTGSIRKVNNVEALIDVAMLLKDQKVKFLIWGDGDQLEGLKERVLEEKLDNVVFKGSVEKKYIPYITSRGDLNIIFGKSLPLFRFGISMNKLFDYLAAGKPILTTFQPAYSIIQKYNTGIELEEYDPAIIAEKIMYLKNLSSEEYQEYCSNSIKAASDYDIKKLTTELEQIIHTSIS